jgi:hypothetical protein
LGGYTQDGSQILRGCCGIHPGVIVSLHKSNSIEPRKYFACHVLRTRGVPWHGKRISFVTTNMKPINRTRTMNASILAGFGILLFSQTTSRAADEIDGITAVAAKVSNDYVRTRLPDGSFQPEYYSFGAGGNWGGELKDVTVDKLTFLDVAHVVALPLASQKYFPARDPNATKLIIMVYWGTTAVPESTQNSAAVQEFRQAQDNLDKYTSTAPSGKQIIAGGGAADAAMAQWSAAQSLLNIVNQQRSRTNFLNAAMLGYDSPGLVGTEYGNNLRGTALGVERDDLVSEIEENRYFVVLMAYDFQLMWKEKKHKLLWETRFSISERRNAFDKALPVMAQFASRYFGQDSHGLLRESAPQGRVEIGDLKSLGEVPAR